MKGLTLKSVPIKGIIGEAKSACTNSDFCRLEN